MTQPASDRLDDVIANISVVDAHCHPFVLDDVAPSLASAFTLSEAALPPGMAESTVMVRRLVRDLGAFLGCQADLAVVDAARARAIADDRDGFVASLFRHANIDMLLFDTGHPVDADGRSTVELSQLAAAVGRPCRTVFRIDPIVDRLVAEQASFDEVLDRIDAEVRDALDAGAVGLKSIIAYRTGLDVELVDRAAARRCYDRFIAGREPGAEKPFRDHVFVWALEQAIHHDVPLQVHTGMGDGPIFDMTTARPALLRRVLIDPGLRRAKLVLTHAGYPWVEESGWLASQYDNVFIDVSEMVPFAAHGVRRKLLALLELAPTSKLMYGSDGFAVPELHWFGAHVGRRALADALGTLVAERWLDDAHAVEIAEAILRRNATDLYRLDTGSTDERGGSTTHG
jgi:hypothetical protein